MLLRIALAVVSVVAAVVGPPWRLRAQNRPAGFDTRMIAIDKDVKLEVLDWGGRGRPVVLLAGLGGTAHAFDHFAPKLAETFHVYAITRRGFGFSTHAASGYSADRLADDVLAVIDSLRIHRPVLAGHSLGGEELSSIGSRHPEKVAGLVYLDAGYGYAFYDTAHGDAAVDLAELRRRIEQFQAATAPADSKRLVRELLRTDLPAVERSLGALKKSLPVSDAKPASPQPPEEMLVISHAIMAGMQRYTSVGAPILAIYAFPHRVPQSMANDPSAAGAMKKLDSTVLIQMGAFQRGLPSARVVRIPNADHNVFISNEADVLREMRAFIEGLPRVKQ